MKIYNMQVTCAGYYFMGHYKMAPLRIVLEGGSIVVEVNPKMQDLFDDLGELFRVFDIDSEDEKYLQDIEGKYCRVIFSEDRRVKALQHITQDNIIWYVNKGDTPE